MTVLRWMLAVILSIFFIIMGVQKFGGPNPVFQYIADHSGMAFFEPQVRLATGTAEITAALLVLVPRTRIFGALLAIAVLGGALAFHVSPWLGINAPVAFAEDGGYIKSPMLFIMALSFFFASAGLLFVELAERSMGRA